MRQLSSAAHLSAARGTFRRFQLVFTPSGGAVLVISLIGLIRSLVMRNSYEIVIFCAALFLLLALGAAGAWKSWKLKSMDAGWKPPFPMTACAAEETEITSLDPQTPGSSIPLFFRLHYIIKGRFFPSDAESCPVLVETSVPRKNTSAKIALDFPMSGVFRGEGFCLLRDIFGFFSFNCGQRQQRTVMVRSSPCFGKKPIINAQTGAEDRRSKPSADEERYYMREYTPGDRLRDINWKSSEKIDSLITRISTDNQEKITRIEVHFRNYGADAFLESLWLLDRAKAQLSYFLRTLMEQNSSFVFDVYGAGKNWEIEDMDDLENFFEELSGLSFMPLKNENFSGAQNKGDIYVFSTACDSGLQGFLLANSQRPVSLFLIQPAGIEKSEECETIIKTEILNLRNFTAMGCGIPPRWLARGKVKPLAVQTGKTDVFYAKVKF